MATTVHDALVHLVDYCGGNADQANQRDFLRAIVAAYRELPALHRWEYLKGEHTIGTVAPYSTGTISYDHATLTVTLTSGTFPSWAATGMLHCSNKYARVKTRTSATVLVVDAVENFGQDIASGSSYSLYRDTFDLPTDFIGADIMGIMNQVTNIVQVTPDAIKRRQIESFYTGSPRVCAFMGSTETPRLLAVRFYPPPDAVYNVQFVYQKTPRALVAGSVDVQAGTISTAGTVTVTGSGTSFVAAYEGAIIRGGTANDLPEGYEGANPYVFERVIDDVTSATELSTLGVISAYTGIKYRISDPIDFPDGAMMNAFLRCCEKQIGMTKIMRDKAPSSGQFNQALRLAMDEDARYLGIRTARVQPPRPRTPDDYTLGDDIGG